MTKEKFIYTVKEVSEILHSSPNYVYDLINKGYLPALKLGSLKIRKEALLAFLEENEGKDLSNLNDIVPLQLELDNNV